MPQILIERSPCGVNATHGRQGALGGIRIAIEVDTNPAQHGDQRALLDLRFLGPGIQNWLVWHALGKAEGQARLVVGAIKNQGPVATKAHATELGLQRRLWPAQGLATSLPRSLTILDRRCATVLELPTVGIGEIRLAERWVPEHRPDRCDRV